MAMVLAMIMDYIMGGALKITSITANPKPTLQPVWLAKTVRIAASLHMLGRELHNAPPAHFELT